MPRARAALLGGTILLLQVAWALVVPAFYGIDEVDHTYRAASVARGHWAPSNDVHPDGRGGRIRVPADIVEAAGPACERLTYMRPENCAAVAGSAAGGEVTVASAADNYNPLYYAVVGTVALPFEGDAASLAMRLTTIALSDLLLFPALMLLWAWSRRPWPAASVALCLTPVVLYATANVAPNGPHLVAGLAAWVGGLVALSDSELRGRAVTLFATAAGVLVMTHTLGLLWLPLIVGTLLALGGFKVLGDRWRHRPGRVATLAATVTVPYVLAGLWVLLAGTNQRGDEADLGTLGVGRLLQQFPLWVLQTIGAVPFRDEHPSVAAFGIWLTVGALVLGGGFVVSARRLRTISFAVLAGSLAIASTLTIVSYPDIGLAWQGRYSLPFAFGVAVVAGLALDRRPVRSLRALPPLVPPLVVAGNGLALWGVATKYGAYAEHGADFGQLVAVVVGVLALVTATVAVLPIPTARTLAPV